MTLNLSGAALERRGYPGKYRPSCTIDANNTKFVFQGLGHGDRDDRWIYTPSRVWIERRDGTVQASRDNPYQAFADHYPAHSKGQLFYFDTDFMLRRMDYAPLAFKVPASRFCFDVEEIRGIKIPMFHRVVGRRPKDALLPSA